MEDCKSWDGVSLIGMDEQVGRFNPGRERDCAIGDQAPGREGSIRPCLSNEKSIPGIQITGEQESSAHWPKDVADTCPQCSLQHQLLPKPEWTTEEGVRHLLYPACQAVQHLFLHLRILTIPFSQDYQYLSPIIEEIEKERSEREDLESMVIKKPQIGSKTHHGTMK